MLDFRTQHKPRNYLGRGEQYRLFLIVALVGLALLAMRHAANPETWAWLREPGEVATGDPSTDLEPPRDLDNRIQPNLDPSDVPDAFNSPAPLDPAEDTSGQYFPGVKPGYLKAVRDDTVWRPEEHQVWFHLLGLLKENDAAAIRAAAEPASFVQLFQQPSAYRGKLVSLQGTVRWAHQVDAQKNDEGIQGYYQLWIQPEGVNFPMLVYCLGLPQDFPTGQDLREEVSVAGFFYKRYVYTAQDGIRTVPLVLAKEVSWKPAVKVAPDKFPAAGTVVVILLALVVAAMVLTRIKSRAGDDHLTPTAEAERVDALKGVETAPSVEQSLSELAKREH